MIVKIKWNVVRHEASRGGYNAAYQKERLMEFDSFSEATKYCESQENTYTACYILEIIDK